MLRVGLIQMCSGRDPARNAKDAEALIRDAAGQKAQFIATPETTNIMDEDLARVRASVAGEAQDETVRRFAGLAAELKVFLMAGSLALVGENGKLVNRCLIWGPDGRLVARYDKIHLFDVDLGGAESYRESDRFAGGDSAVLADVAGAKLGLTICYDVRFPALHRALALKGAEILTGPAAFTRITGEAHWHVLLRARAIETGSFVLAPAQSGRHETGRETYGHTLAINPWGKVIAELAEGPGVVMADLDLAEVAAARAKIPALKNARDFRS